MGTSSARPDHLDDFSRRSRAADRELQQTVGKLKALHSEFVAALDWGHFDASSLLNGYGAYLGENEFDAEWVATIAAAFRAAGSKGGIARLPDAAIKASLRAAGLDRNRKSVTSTTRSRVSRRRPATRTIRSTRPPETSSRSSATSCAPGWSRA
jgi:hypothetical protein